MPEQPLYSISEFANIIKKESPSLGVLDDTTAVNRYLVKFPEDIELVSDEDKKVFTSKLENGSRPGKEIAADFDKRYVFNLKSAGVGIDDAAVGMVALANARPPIAKEFNREKGGVPTVQYFQGMPVGVAYEREGDETVSQREKREAVFERYSNMAADMHKESMAKIQQWVDDDIELQAYLNWKQDEPLTVSNFLKHPASLFGRALSEALPSLTIMAASYAVGGPAASILTMTAMETSSEFQESMAFYLERGFDNQRAVEMSASSAALYGPISGLLENLPMFRMLKRTGLGKIGKRFLASKIDDVILKESLRTGGIKVLMSEVARGGGIILETSLTEGVEEWTQLMAQRVIQEAVREGYGVTPDGAVKNLWEIIKTEPGQFETFFTGAIGGTTFAALGYTASTRQFKLRMDESGEAGKAGEGVGQLSGKTLKFDPPIQVSAPGEEQTQTPSDYLRSIISFGATGELSNFNAGDLDDESELGVLAKKHSSKKGKIAPLSVGAKIKEVLETFGESARKDLSQDEKDYINNVLKSYVKKSNVLENIPEFDDMAGLIEDGSIEISDEAILDEGLLGATEAPPEVVIKIIDAQLAKLVDDALMNDIIDENDLEMSPDEFLDEAPPEAIEEYQDFADEIDYQDALEHEEEVSAEIIKTPIEKKVVKVEAKSKIIVHSGGASGADSAFQNEAEKSGYIVKAHSFKGHSFGNKARVEHTPAELKEADRHLNIANKTLGRRFPTSKDFVNNLLRRNYFQVKDSEQIIAVSRISNGQVDGGTAWATQMGIDMEKPVYVFDMKTNKWNRWEDSSGTYVNSEAPVIKGSFAGIGSRDLTPTGKNEIQKLFTPTQQIKPVKITKQKFISRTDLKKNPDKVYLFGDNLKQTGFGGQAKQMRGEPNAVGIPTKKAPSNTEGSFFNDAEYAENVKAIDTAFAKIPEGKDVVIPEDGLGTGLASLKNKAPKTFEYLNSKLQELTSKAPVEAKPIEKLTKTEKSSLKIEGSFERKQLVDEEGFKYEQFTKDDRIGDIEAKIKNIGQGTRFVNAIKKERIAEGKEIIRAESPPESIVFWEKMGFEQTGKVKDVIHPVTKKPSTATELIYNIKPESVEANLVAVSEKPVETKPKVDTPEKISHFTLKENIPNILEKGFNTKLPPVFGVSAYEKVEKFKPEQKIGGEDVLYFTTDKVRWNKAEVYVGEGNGTKDYKFYDYKKQKWETEKKALNTVNLESIEAEIKEGSNILVIDSAQKFFDFQKKNMGSAFMKDRLDDVVRKASELGYDVINIKDTGEWINKDGENVYDVATGLSGKDDYFILNKDVLQVEQPIKIPLAEDVLTPAQLTAFDENLQTVEFEQVEELEAIPETNEFGLSSEEIVAAETVFNKDVIGKVEPIRKNIETIGEGVRKVASETFKGLSEKFKDEKGFIKLGKTEDEVYETSSEHFEEAWNTAKDTYKLGENDFKTIFIPAMMNYINKIRAYNRKLAGALKKLLTRWVREFHSDSDKVTETEVAPIIKNKARVIGKLEKKITRANVGRKMERLQLWDGAVDDNLLDDSDDNSREGIGVYHTSDAREISRNMRSDSFNLTNTVLYSFLGDFVSNADARDIEHHVRTDSFEKFSEFIYNNFGKAAETTTQENLFHYYWNRNQKINKQNRSTYIEYMYANINENGIQTRPKDKFIVLKEGTDLRTGNVIPANAPVSFSDWDFLNGKNSIQTGRLRLSDIVTVRTSKEKDDDGNDVHYAIPANVELSAQTLLEWDIMLSTLDSPAVIAGLKGGTKPSILFTQVTKKHIKDASEGKWAGEKYWSKELSDGYIIESHIKDVQMSATLLARNGNKLAMAQMIARHEWAKSKMHNNYIFDGSVQDIFKRFNLAFSEGTVSVGAGGTTVRLFDPRKVELRYDGKVIEMIGDYGGNPDSYRFDGSVFVSGQYLKDQEVYQGRKKTSKSGKGLDELKTVTRYRSDDGNDHINFKGMEMVPDANLEFVDKETGTIIAKTVIKAGLVNIIDENGHIIGKLATLDEAKNVNGIFRLNSREHEDEWSISYTDVLDIPEDATRSIIIPAEFSKKSASFVNQWLDILTHPDFGDVRSAMTKHIVGVVNSYISRLFDMRNNPQLFEKYVKAVVEEGTSLPSRISQLIIPDNENYIEDGYLMAEISSILLNNISNRMITDGAFKGRREGEGSYLNMKPDMTDTVVEGTIHVSAKNTTILNKLRKLSGLTTVADINEWLTTEPKSTWVLISRFPINDVPSVQMLQIAKLREGQHGDSIFIHSNYVFDELKADHDGDKTFVEFFNEELTAKLRGIKNKDAFKEKQKMVNLSNYKHLDTNNSYLDIAQFYNVANNIVQSVNSQSIVTNAKSLRGVLLTKGFKINIDGVEIVPTAEVIKDDSDLVVQDYAVLVGQPSLSKGDKVVNRKGERWKSGSKYLKTSSEHDLSILMQAATDNTKEMLLGMWIKNSGYSTIKDFMLSRIFKRVDGEKLTQSQINSLSFVADYYKYSPLRQGKSQKNVKQNMTGIFNESYEINKRIISSVDEQQASLQNFITASVTDDMKFGRVPKEFGLVKDVVLNGRTAPVERILSELTKVYDEYSDKNPNDVVVGNPFGYTVRRQRNARHVAVSKLFRQANKYHITDVEAKKGLVLATQMMDEYSSIFEARQQFKRKPENKHKISSDNFDTNEAINDFVSRWMLKLKESGIDVADMDTRKNNSILAAITLFSLRGVPKIRTTESSIYLGRDVDIQKLLPPELMSLPVYYDYASFYGKELKTSGEKGINVAHLDPAMEIKLEC